MSLIAKLRKIQTVQKVLSFLKKFIKRAKTIQRADWIWIPVSGLAVFAIGGLLFLAGDAIISHLF